MKIVRRKILDELGYCGKCRQLFPIECVHFSDGHEATWLVFHECGVQRLAIITMGAPWTSITIASAP